jgi:hypothetical protein
MIELRKKESVLKNGSFKFLKCNSKNVVYSRFNEKEGIIFVKSQDKRKNFIVIPLDPIGQVQSLEILYGDGFKYEVNQNILHCFVDKEETILIKTYFKK